MSKPSKVFSPFDAIDRTLTPVYKAIPAIAPMGQTGLGTTANPIGPQRQMPTAPTAPIVIQGAPQLQTMNNNIETAGGGDTSTFLKAAKAAGDSAFALDPLGRRGSGAAARATMLGK